MSDTGKTPETTENVHAMAEMSGADLKPKSMFGKIAAFLSDKFLKPPIITVFVTALLGPVAVQWVNDSIENKKLQEKVIQTVLNYTNEADFSKPESIEKIGIIAQMVNENQPVFELSFEETSRAISKLNDASNDVGIKNLTNKLKDVNVKIKDLSARFSGDSARLASLQISSVELMEKKERASKTNQDKLREIDNQLAKIQLDIKELENNRNFYREQLRYWTEQKITLEADIEAASNDLSEVLKTNRNKEEILQQEKEQLKVELAKTLSEMSMLKNTVNIQQTQIQELVDSINTLKIVKNK